MMDLSRNVKFKVDGKDFGVAVFYFKIDFTGTIGTGAHVGYYFKENGKCVWRNGNPVKVMKECIVENITTEDGFTIFHLVFI